MSRITILPAAVVARIAAGEMIERPVSVVKELVENAIDAGATRIILSVEGSLDRALSLSDNGTGMMREEVELAVRRHATSKIRDVEDLFRLRTLGFRGEALASIAAVSSLVISTCAAEGEPGTEIEVVGGELLAVRGVARARGTTVTVRDLYFNVPVRRKFLKTERGELRVAGRLLSHLAIAQPAIHFAFERSSMSPIVYEPAPSLRERVGQVFGRSTAERMLAVSREADGALVTGLAGAPEQSRMTREHQILIVNGRPVVSPLLMTAAKAGYRDLIPPERQPMVVLAIEIDPSLVDVNVHPTKREVKFAREGAVFEAVRDAVQEALSALSPARGMGTSGFVREDRSPGREPGFGRGEGVGPLPRPATADLLDLWARPASGLPPAGAASGGERPPAPAPAGEEGQSVARVDEPKFWQLHRRYVFAQTGSGVLVIDQHAAHERVLYERALARLDGSETPSQRLLFPEPIELSASEIEVLQEIGAELERLGFEIDLFGTRAIVLRAIPADVREPDPARLVHDFLDEYAHVGRSIRATRERVARAFACRAAIKSGTPLSPIEMRELIDALFATSTPHGDPHGRPTLIQLSLDDLDRRFGRS